MANLTFVMSGLFESLERDEATDLVKKYGGRVTTSLSKKTNYFVVGDDAGLAKLAKADDLRVKTLTEDGLLDLIRKKSGLPVQQKESKVVSPKKEPKDVLPKKESKKEPKGVSPMKEPKGVSPKKQPKGVSPKKEPKDDKSPQAYSKAKSLKVEHKSPKKEFSATVTSTKSETLSTPPKTKSESPPQSKVKVEPREKLHDLQIKRTVTEYQKDIASESNQAWVEKYKPVKMKDIIGQQGGASNSVK